MVVPNEYHLIAIHARNIWYILVKDTNHALKSLNLYEAWLIKMVMIYHLSYLIERNLWWNIDCAHIFCPPLKI